MRLISAEILPAFADYRTLLPSNLPTHAQPHRRPPPLGRPLPDQSWRG